MTTETLERILSVLDGLYPRTECFLHHTKDYELLFAVILSAQATDVSVNRVTETLFQHYPSLESFGKATVEDIQKEIKSIGLSKAKSEYLVKTARILLAEYGGVLPKDREKLMTLPGVGFKTSGVVLAELYDDPYLPVDTHVKRVVSRLGIVSEKLTPEETELALEKKIHKDHIIQIHRRFILFGRNVCLARNPRCENCPLNDCCRYRKKNSDSKKG